MVYKLLLGQWVIWDHSVPLHTTATEQLSRTAFWREVYLRKCAVYCVCVFRRGMWVCGRGVEWDKLYMAIICGNCTRGQCVSWWENTDPPDIKIFQDCQEHICVLYTTLGFYPTSVCCMQIWNSYPVMQVRVNQDRTDDLFLTLNSQAQRRVKCVI